MVSYPLTVDVDGFAKSQRAAAVFKVFAASKDFPRTLANAVRVIACTTDTTEGDTRTLLSELALCLQYETTRRGA